MAAEETFDPDLLLRVTPTHHTTTILATVGIIFFRQKNKIKMKIVSSSNLSIMKSVDIIRQQQRVN